LSRGRRSLDDVARSFFGRENTGPQVFTYTRDDVIAALNAVQPYDWRGFLAQRVDAVTPHPPDAFSAAGWRLVYTAVPNAFAKLQADRRKSVDARYSLGLLARTDGTITDVLNGSPAARAGLGPGAKIVAVNDRAVGTQLQADLDTALRAAQRGPGVALLVVAGEMYREVVIEYHGGPRFAHLERISGTPDALTAIAAPLSSAR
jgi:predicted metalloprotease with PDZ domain